MSTETIENLKQSCIDAVMLFTDEEVIQHFELESHPSAQAVDALRDIMIDALYQHRLQELS
jgi:hypothetical protein